MSFESELRQYEDQQDTATDRGEWINRQTQKLLVDGNWTGDILADIEKNAGDALHEVIIDLFMSECETKAHGKLHELFREAARQIAINQWQPKVRRVA